MLKTESKRFRHSRARYAAQRPPWEGAPSRKQPCCGKLAPNVATMAISSRSRLAAAVKRQVADAPAKRLDGRPPFIATFGASFPRKARAGGRRKRQTSAPLPDHAGLWHITRTSPPAAFRPAALGKLAAPHRRRTPACKPRQPGSQQHRPPKRSAAARPTATRGAMTPDDSTRGTYDMA